MIETIVINKISRKPDRERERERKRGGGDLKIWVVQIKTS